MHQLICLIASNIEFFFVEHGQLNKVVYVINSSTSKHA